MKPVARQPARGVGRLPSPTPAPRFVVMRRPPTEQEIARRAYELYQQRGHGDEQAAADWDEAKAELEAAEVDAESEDRPPGLLELSAERR